MMLLLRRIFVTAHLGGQVLGVFFFGQEFARLEPVDFQEFLSFGEHVFAVTTEARVEFLDRGF